MAVDAKKPAAPGTKNSSTSGKAPAVKDVLGGGGFAALAMAHKNFGLEQKRGAPVDDAAARKKTRPGVPPASAGAKARFSFEKINREVQMKRLESLVHSVGDWFSYSPEERAKEIERIPTLTDTQVAELFTAYEFAHAHVLIMTDDAHARNTALARSADLQAFYEKHGVSQEQASESAASLRP